MQLYIYAIGFQHRYGIWPESMELRFIESGLSGKIEFKESELQNALRIIEEAADAIRKREFPATPTYQKCRYCQVRQICSFSAY